VYGLCEHQELEGARQLDTSQTMDKFLASVERRAYRMASVATSNPDDALDIVQDSMLKLATKYADRPPQEWGPLFHRIMQSTIKDWYRRQGVRRKWTAFLSFAGVGNEDSEQPDPFENVADRRIEEPDQQMHLNQSMHGLQEALGNLPRRQQQVFMLRAWEGLSVKEAAQAMSCSDGSVKTHYHRAVQSLQQVLKDFE